jgi:hypothetical protein
VITKLPYIDIDPWREHAPMILTESRSLAGVLRDLVADYRARIASANGQCGGFLRTDIAPALVPETAAFILREASALGIRVGTNGNEVVLIAPLKVPTDVRREFERAIDQHRQEIIDQIMRGGAGHERHGTPVEIARCRI